jgi:hypothetical protein
MTRQPWHHVRSLQVATPDRKPLFTTCQDLWKIRNEERHSKDDKTKTGPQAAQVKHDLRALYLLQPEVLAADRDLFHDSVDDHLTDAIYTIS